MVEDGGGQVPVRRDNTYVAWERKCVFWEIRRRQDERTEESWAWVWTPRVLRVPSTHISAQPR